MRIVVHDTCMFRCGAFEVWDAIPLKSTGKIDKKLIRATLHFVAKLMVSVGMPWLDGIRTSI